MDTALGYTSAASAAIQHRPPQLSAVPALWHLPRPPPADTLPRPIPSFSQESGGCDQDGQRADG
eukprot:CAMPEP_0177620014 /NCGR_PEP_ID=MMETSP0419_2-20121207/26626_1 /TAXON_ID=582737 /ORGANISM="Tetraselmis sp., Strain GSL018" /LENGTH=63 /DNA_ID=CAMNT_0019119437 /DNA_START=86 /DNA_END=273 /DNA_ORIENTATION=+